MKSLLISSLILVTAYGGPAGRVDLKAVVEEVNTSGAKWKAGHNFGEKTNVDSLQRLLGVRKDGVEKLPLRAKHQISNSDIPESFDARTNWPQCKSIGHISDQGNCESCWAVSAADAFTDRLCIATNGSFTSQLSSEDLLSCCSLCGFGCGGGWPQMAWRYFATDGLATGGDYGSNVGCQPYGIQSCSHYTNTSLPSCDTLPLPDTSQCQRNCTNPAYSTPYSADRHKIVEAYSISETPEELQKEIMTHGPVQAVFLVYTDFLTYKSGVYHQVAGFALGHHSVKLIGWGVEGNTSYWLAANQWNESWGDGGFFKILRGQDECGIEAEIQAGVPIV